MKIHILDRTKKNKFIESTGFGIETKKVPYLFLLAGNERIRAFSGDLSSEELMAIWRLFPVEGVGLYFGKDIINRRSGNKESRLSLDALHVLNKEIRKNIIDINQEQEDNWFLGKNIEVSEGQTEEVGKIDGGNFVALRSGGDFVGVGKLSQDKRVVVSFLPKERRRRS